MLDNGCNRDCPTVASGAARRVWLLSRFGAKRGMLSAPLSIVEINLKALDGSPPYSTNKVGWRDVDREQRTIVEVMRGLSYRGSEVRVSTGQLLRPMQCPKSPVDTQMWRWKLAFSQNWRWPAYFNELETRAALAVLT